jgi:hypothetical protein
MTRTISTLVAASLLTFTACETDDIINLDFSQPQVSAVAPADRQENVGVDATVTLIFSKSMDRVKTANSFSLSSSKGRVDGYFTWDAGGRVMTFHPSGKGLSGGQAYSVIVSVDAEDTGGNDLLGPFASVFYVGSDITPPYVARFSPAHNSQVADPNQVIEIVFSEPVDYDTVYSGFSLSPSAQGLFRFEERFDPPQNRVVTAATFDPTYPLPFGTTYAVTVSTAVKDPNGNPLREECAFNFTMGTDFQRPSILSVTQTDPVDGGSVVFADPTGATENTLVERDCDLIVHFSEPVKVSSLQGAVTLSDGADFYLLPGSPADSVTVKFREPLKSQDHYLLTVTQSVTDLGGNQLDTSYRYRFLTDGERSTRPSVVSMKSVQGGDESLLADGATVYPVKLACRYYAEFSKDIDPGSIEVSVEKVAGPEADSPSMINPNWDDAPASFRIYSFDLNVTKAGNTYRITIEGANVTKDSRGNYLEKDVSRYVKYELQ